MVLLIIIPMKNGYFIGGIPHFQTYPYVGWIWLVDSGILGITHRQLGILGLLGILRRVNRLLVKPEAMCRGGPSKLETKRAMEDGPDIDPIGSMYGIYMLT